MKKNYLTVKNYVFEELKGSRAEKVKEIRTNIFSKCGGWYLFNIYASYSRQKEKIEDNILEIMSNMDGYKYTVHGGNSSFFSCSFEDDNNIYYFTHCNSYIIKKHS